MHSSAAPVASILRWCFARCRIAHNSANDLNLQLNMANAAQIASIAALQVPYYILQQTQLASVLGGPLRSSIGSCVWTACSSEIFRRVYT